MKKIILIFSLYLGFFVFFLPSHIFADYTQELNVCNKILSKSSSIHEYCTLNINAIFGNRVTGPMVVISNAYIYPESGVTQATKFLEEEYKSKLDWMRDPSDQSNGLVKYMKVIEEAGPDSMKFLIRQNPSTAFYSSGPKKIIYTYHSYLFMQQGSCVMVVDGDANKGYIKRQGGRNDDVDGDVEKLKQESIFYMNKVGNDLIKNCKKEIVKTETPVVPALIDKPPKESDFKKVAKSDFKLIYPVSSDSASLKAATQSSGMAFIGKVSGDGELLVEFPKGQTVTLKDDYTGADVGEARVIWQHNVKLLNHRFTFHISEIDCHIQIARDIARAEGDAVSLANLGVVRRPGEIIHPERVEVIVGDCSDLNIESLVRIFVQKGPAIFNMQNGFVVAEEGADLGIFNNTNSGLSTVEVYNGSVTVKNSQGQSRTISAVYGGQINRIEVGKDGVMTEKIAIPQSEWEAFLASNQKKEKEINLGRNLSMIPIVVVLAMGGLIFFLYRTGKLVSLHKTSSRKISEPVEKISKGEKKS
ncbi:MAG: hypothetical protein M1450_01440 [Patescibacteria group bacterium]|nr:hypothetical protein [Patescibacteria group bacterium]